MINYQKIQPPGYLKNHVLYFWSLTYDCGYSCLKALGPLADGCPGLIFQPSDKGTYVDQYDKKLPELFIYGQTVKRTKLYLSGKFETIGICFYPHALKSVFGFDAHELTDSCLELNLIPLEKKTSISERLSNISLTVNKIELLSSYLQQRIKKSKRSVDAVTHYALIQIIQSKGSVSLNKLQKKINLSERSLERRFQHHVGISPKLFSRINRFQACLEQLKNSAYTKLSDIAFKNGYADQSHFIREFKEFSGFSPYQFQKQSDKIAEKFPVLIK